MEKNNAVLEITSNNLKLVIGYVLEDKVYVLYALSSPLPEGIIVDGAVNDYPALVNEIKKITSIKDESAKLKIKIQDAILCLPPYGLQVFHTKQVTTVVSDESRVTMLDIRNIHALITKEKVPSKNEIVDIIPEQFILDQDRSFRNPPLNELSNTITMCAKVHTLPKTLIADLTNAVTDAGIHVSRSVVSSFGAIELLGSYPDMPTDYFLVDVGGKVTTVSLAGQKQLFGSTHFNWGGDNITEKIAEKFQINMEDAKKYKELYGYSHRDLTFEPIICKVEDEYGNITKHKLNELNAIMKSEMENFISQLLDAVKFLLTDYDTSYRELPVVLIGGGSMLNGFKEFIEPKIPNEKVYTAMPKVVGARHPMFFNCIGVMKAASKYRSVYDETHPKISTVTREKNN